MHICQLWYTSTESKATTLVVSIDNVCVPITIYICITLRHIHIHYHISSYMAMAYKDSHHLLIKKHFMHTKTVIDEY